MIKKWYVTGDCHRDFSRFRLTADDGTNFKTDSEAAVVILGDVGINYCLNEEDNKIKGSIANTLKGTFYCLHGNHEARPQTIEDIKLIYDENVDGEVYIQENYPNIRYFKDWGIYNIGGYKTAVIGGAYSVDKWYRLIRAGVNSKLDYDYLNCKKTHWFPDEQLSVEEMVETVSDLRDQTYEFIFTHTCPINWAPTDLFLSGISQDDIDKSMEIFLSELAQKINWDIWCFGHYHDDRLVRPHVEMFYKDIENLDTIWKRWQNYDDYNELDWWLKKDPMFFMV